MDVDRVALEVEVVDWELRQVAGATVTLLHEKARDGRSVDLPVPSPNAWKTDGRGRCTVSFPEQARESVFLFAEREGVGTSGKTWVRREEGTGRVRLVLFPPAHLSGRVFRGAGVPAPGVTVRFTFESPLGFRSGQRGRAPGPLETDKEGGFEADLDAGGRYVVWASDGEVESERTFVYSDAGSRQELALWLEGALTIEARLLDPSGNPVAAGSVMAWEQDPPQPLTPGIATPGSFRRVDRSQGGRFTLPVPRPGSYAVVGFSERFASSLPEFVEVEEGNAHTDASLSLLDFAFISGRVRHASGAPSKGTPIRAVPVRGSEPYADVSGETGADYLHVTAEVRAGEDGSFRIQGLHPHATYRLLLPLGPRGTDLRAVARPVPAGTEDLEIVVPEDGSAAVNVVLELASPTQGPDDRPGVELWHETGLGSWKQEERAASEGGKDAPPRGPWRFRLEGLIPGDRYVLHASALGYGAALRGPWTARTGEDERVVRLEAPSTIEVEVRDADGRALPSASVFCERATECDPLRAPMRVLTPAGGVVRFDGLGPGPYRLASVRGTARSEWTAVEVAGGERRALVLTLEP